jgi:hypothetical protein
LLLEDEAETEVLLMTVGMTLEAVERRELEATVEREAIEVLGRAEYDSVLLPPEIANAAE